MYTYSMTGMHVIKLFTRAKRPLMQRRVIYEQLSYYMSTVHEGCRVTPCPPSCCENKTHKVTQRYRYIQYTYIHNPQTLLIAGLDKTQYDLLKFEFADWNAHCLGMNYYVNFWGGIGSNGFHIK